MGRLEHDQHCEANSEACGCESRKKLRDQRDALLTALLEAEACIAGAYNDQAIDETLVTVRDAIAKSGG